MTASQERALIDDPSSGLFSQAFLLALLPTRVATARRSLRQLGLVLVELAPTEGAAVDLDEVGELVRRTLRDSDIAARLDDGRLAMLLEFTPVHGCVVVAERVARKLTERLTDLSCWAGVACYPAHAIDDQELLVAAADALAGASEGPSGTVAVAPVAD